MFEIARRLSIEAQFELIDLCRQIVAAAPLFRKTMPTGAAFRYLCTSAGQYGWLSDRKGYRYESKHPITKAAFPEMPDLIKTIAIETAAQYGLSLIPESALINWYDADSTLGLHQDNTEKSLAPVISISLGDDCSFILGGERRQSPKKTLRLQSGDVFIMGAEHRLYFHGVKKIFPNTAPSELGMKQAGRINITVRQVYEK